MRGSDAEWSKWEYLKSKQKGEDIVIREWHAFIDDSWAVNKDGKVLRQTVYLHWHRKKGTEDNVVEEPRHTGNGWVIHIEFEATCNECRAHSVEKDWARCYSFWWIKRSTQSIGKWQQQNGERPAEWYSLVLVWSGWYNKIPQTAWLINKRKVFLTVLKSGSLRSRD